jgi:DnaK suppressor protein
MNQTTSTPDKNALFTSDELDNFRSLLEDERSKLLKKAKQMVEAGNIHVDKNEMMDEVDLASVTVEQTLTFKLMDRDRKLLAEIEHALSKIDSGEYGYCEGTGEAIPKRRLEVRPWCKYSVKYKEQLEKRKKSGRGVGDDDDLVL